MSLQGPFSPAGWASSYSKDHAPSWAPDPDGSALGQLGTFLGCESRWKTIRQAFMKSDNDGNGVITRDELEIMCRDMGLSAEVGAGLLNEFDMDENGEWNYHEFCDVLRKQDYITYSQCIPREQYPKTLHGGRKNPKRPPSPPPAIRPAPREYDMLNGAALGHVEQKSLLDAAGPRTNEIFSPKSWKSNYAVGYTPEWGKHDIMEHLTAGQSARKLFDDIDDDRSGVIDREEVARLLRELGISMTRDKLEYAMHQMDPNGDNEISFEEFEAWYDKQEGLLARTEDESLVGKKVTSLRDAFKRADKQGGGTIDRDELQQMCIALTLPKETQAALLNQIDMDGDGEWCYAEFIKVLTNIDYGTYHSTEGSTLPKAPGKIVPPARKFNLFSGRPYTPPAMLAKRALSAKQVQERAFPAAHSPRDSPRAGRRSVGTTPRPSPRPSVEGGVAIQQQQGMANTADKNFTSVFHNDTTDFRHQAKKAFDPSMGQASKLGGIAGGTNRVLQGSAGPVPTQPQDTLDDFARSTLGFDGSGRPVIHAPHGASGTPRGGEHRREAADREEAAIAHGGDIRSHLPSWANVQGGAQNLDVAPVPETAPYDAEAQALERIEARAKEHGSVDLARDLYQQQQGTRGRDEAGRVASQWEGRAPGDDSEHYRNFQKHTPNHADGAVDYTNRHIHGLV